MFVLFRTTTWRGALAGPQDIKHTCHDYCYLPACNLGNWARIIDLLYVTVTNFEYTIFVYLMSMHLHQMYKIHGWYRQLGIGQDLKAEAGKSDGLFARPARCIQHLLDVLALKCWGEGLMCGCVRESEDVKVVRCARRTQKWATRAFFFLTVCSCTCYI